MSKKITAQESGEKKYQYIRKTEVYEGKRYEGWGKTEAEAYKKLSAKLEAAKRGEDGISPQMKVQTWSETWLKDYIKPKVREAGKKKERGTMAPKNFRMYEQTVRLYINPVIGKRRMRDVTEPELRRILNGLKGDSYSHIAKVRIVIKAMFRQAWASGIILRDPAALLEMPAAEKGKRRSLTPVEKEVFYRITLTHPHGMLFRFMAGTGMRPNEVAAARVGDVDFDRNLVKVNKAVESGAKVIADTKTSLDRFTILNTSEDKTFAKDLKAYAAGKDEDAFLFTETDGETMMSEQCLKRYWQSLVYAMDISMGAEATPHGHIYDPKDVRNDGTPLYPDPDDPKKPRNGHRIAPDLVTYCLRHTFGTNMQRSGVPIDVTKYLMGHRDITTTANIYVDSGEPEALRAVEYIARCGENVGKQNKH